MSRNLFLCNICLYFHNLLADLNTSIHVTSVFFPFGKGGGGGSLMAEACRAYLVWNAIFFYLA